MIRWFLARTREKSKSQSHQKHPYLVLMRSRPIHPKMKLHIEWEGINSKIPNSSKSFEIIVWSQDMQTLPKLKGQHSPQRMDCIKISFANLVSLHCVDMIKGKLTQESQTFRMGWRFWDIPFYKALRLT